MINGMVFDFKLSKNALPSFFKLLSEIDPNQYEFQDAEPVKTAWVSTGQRFVIATSNTEIIKRIVEVSE